MPKSPSNENDSDFQNQQNENSIDTLDSVTDMDKYKSPFKMEKSSHQDEIIEFEQSQSVTQFLSNFPKFSSGFEDKSMNKNEDSSCKTTTNAFGTLADFMGKFDSELSALTQENATTTPALSTLKPIFKSNHNFDFKANDVKQVDQNKDAPESHAKSCQPKPQVKPTNKQSKPAPKITKKTGFKTQV